MPHQLLPSTTELHVRTRGYLPHWELPDATYSVTFRLHDSLPREAVDRIRLALETEKQLDDALDRHDGIAFMRDQGVADIVADSLCFFDGLRYRLFAWCVMPNHVHVVVQPIGVCTLRSVIHSWKSYSSNAANAVLARTGSFWAREYFDRIIRNDRDLERTIDYVLNNPGKAGLRDWRWTSAGWKPAERPAGSRRS